MARLLHILSSPVREFNNPASIPGLTAWLDVGNGARLSVDGGGYVSLWDPEFGDLILSQDISLYQPYYNQSGPRHFLEFTQSLNQCMLDQNHSISHYLGDDRGTIFVAWCPLSGQVRENSGVVYSNDLLIGTHEESGTLGLHAYHDGDLVVQAYNFDGTEDVASTSGVYDTWQVSTWRHGEGVLAVTRNGEAEVTAYSDDTVSLTGHICVCGTQWMIKNLGCYLGEIIIYNRSLNLVERASVQNYLHQKWVAA